MYYTNICYFLSDRRKTAMRDVIDAIRCTQVDAIVDIQWKNTERKARARKAGAVFSLQVLCPLGIAELGSC